MRSSPKALLVSYGFPPTGGAGIHRVLKLAKYLPTHGVSPAVLTAQNPSVPLRDESLLRDIPADMPLLRARTLEPGYAVKAHAWRTSSGQGGSWRARAWRRVTSGARQLLLPDPQILWQPGAQFALARHLAGAERPDVVFVTAPPFSQFLLAPLARLARGTAVVLDYRDEWSTLRQSYEMVAGGLPKLAGEFLEERLLRFAHAVTAATEDFRQNLLRRFSFLRPERVFAIPNGYDREDIPASLPAPTGDRLVVTYAGTIFRLTSPVGLLGAVRRLHAESPELARLLRLRFLGRIVETELSRFEGTEALGVERVGYLPHDAMMQEVAASHLLLCLLDDTLGAQPIYPAKIFELMALGRPCLTLAPEGALAELVRATRLGDLLPPRDEARIAEYLARLLADFRDGRVPAQAPPVGIERYDRKALAGEFADVFRRAIAWARE
ncbi:MAG TPA: glycosyltransferase [Polyangia bacterium]|jgi:Glycosyltransferase|nr:glycosyltransferase [Polyangia bacterium]